MLPSKKKKPSPKIISIKVEGYTFSIFEGWPEALSDPVKSTFFSVHK